MIWNDVNSSGLPTKDDYYIVTVVSCYGSWSDVCWFDSGKQEFGIKRDHKWYSVTEGVTAWMPMPQPYEHV